MMIGTAALAAAGLRAPQACAGDPPPSPALSGLFDQFMKERLDLSPMDATSYGLDTGARAHQKHEVDDGSLAGNQAQKIVTASQLTRLKALDRSTLSKADATSYDVVLYDLSTSDAANRLCDYGLPGGGDPYALSQLNGSYQYLPRFLGNQHTIDSAADAEAYLDRLNGFDNCWIRNLRSHGTMLLRV